MKLYNIDQIRRIDQSAMSALALEPIELMARAAHACVDQLLECWPGEHPILVICGKGNNGGDGLLMAERLHQLGKQVSIYLLESPAMDDESEPRAAGEAYKRCLSVGLVPRLWMPEQEALPEADIIVDALLGTGLNTPLRSKYALAIEKINHHDGAVLSVDLPSGLNADTGQPMPIAVKADHSVCLIALKQGLFTGSAVDFCGEISLANLGVPLEVFEESGSAAELVHPDAMDLLPPMPIASHKGDYGHVLVVGGEPGYAGAPILAAESALRAGAGLVSVATHPEHAAYVIARNPCLMAHGITSAAHLLPLINQADTIVVGPGLTHSEWGRDLTEVALSARKPLIVDAGAIALMGSVKYAGKPLVMTPHPGEAGALLGQNASTIQTDRFAAIKHLVAQYGVWVVLKGWGSLVLGPEEKQAWVCHYGSGALSVAGSGDVLAGILGAFMARGDVREIFNPVGCGCTCRSRRASCLE